MDWIVNKSPDFIVFNHFTFHLSNFSKSGNETMETTVFPEGEKVGVRHAKS
jgi:hypothetical protein